MYNRFTKRLLDIIFAILTLLVWWPIYLVIALLVKIKITSPIIFKQLQAGRDDRHFYVYKFRTMLTKKDDHGNDLPDKERRTKFGDRLRRTSLDKLPEVWNVLRGEMSFVGPRPQLIKNYVFFNDSIRERQKVRPGLFSITSNKKDGSWDDALKADLEYASKVTLWKDIKVIFHSVIRLFSKLFGKNKGIDYAREDYGSYLLRTSQITEEQYKNTIVDSHLIIGLRENKDAWPNH